MSNTPGNNPEETPQNDGSKVAGLEYDLTVPEISTSEWFEISGKIDEALNAPPAADTTDPTIVLGAQVRANEAVRDVVGDNKLELGVPATTYREDLETNSDGTPNPNLPRE
jgi:hypothetical protein